MPSAVLCTVCGATRIEDCSCAFSRGADGWFKGVCVSEEITRLREENQRLRGALQTCYDIAIGKHHAFPSDRSATIESVVKKELKR